MPVQWKASKEDAALITRIVRRAEKIILGLPGGEQIERLDANMDIAAVHLNGTPLDLVKFLGFEQRHFLHDFYGIERHVSRETGILTRGFLPYCAARAPEPEPEVDPNLLLV